jgi:glutamate racemase
VYFADTANCPYGNKEQAEILEYALQAVQRLMQYPCKLIVVACNTATTAAIKTLRKNYDLPFVGIEPAIKPAARNTRSGVIGILATKQTVYSDQFNMLTQAHAQGVKVHIEIGYGLVEAIEQNRMNHPDTQDLLNKYIYRMLNVGADQIVLGCTHYPFLIEMIKPMIKGKAHLINPAPAVARQARSVLSKLNLLSNQPNGTSFKFLSTAPDHQVLDMFVERLFGIKKPVI